MLQKKTNPISTKQPFIKKTSAIPPKKAPTKKIAVDLLPNIEKVGKKNIPISSSKKEALATKATSPRKKKERNILKPTEQIVQYFEKTNWRVREYNELLLGKTISHNNKNYTFTNFIGCGSFACVFLALDDDDNKYAIKVSWGPQYGDFTFKQEVDCLKHAQKICGKDIVCYVDSFSKIINKDDYYFIVTEYAEGFVSLADYLNLSKEYINFTEEQAKKYEKTLHRILKALEENGIAHRDIATRNILYNPTTDEFRLIDFGRCYTNNNKRLIEEDRKEAEDLIRQFKKRIKK